MQHQLDLIAAKITEQLQRKYQARERGLQNGREVIRNSANAIRAVHRGDMETAHGLLDRAKQLLGDAGEALRQHPDIYYAGFLQDAEKEYAEAHITLALVSGDAMPDPDALGVGYAPYLNGAGEAVGELRRQVLDRLRRRETRRCEELLAAMDDVYTMLVTMDFPDAMTGGLRRTTDAVRGILERTRGDLTMALLQDALVARLDRIAHPE